MGVIWSSCRSDHMYLISFSAEIVGNNSALVELRAVTDWVFEGYNIVPPARMMTNPVVDRCFWGLLAYTASTNTDNLVKSKSGKDRKSLGKGDGGSSKLPIDKLP